MNPNPIAENLGRMGLGDALDLAAFAFALLTSTLVPAAIARSLLTRLGRWLAKSSGIVLGTALDRVRKGGGSAADLRAAIKEIDDRFYGCKARTEEAEERVRICEMRIDAYDSAPETAATLYELSDGQREEMKRLDAMITAAVLDLKAIRERGNG